MLQVHDLPPNPCKAARSLLAQCLSMCCPEPFTQAHSLPPNPRKAAIKKRMGSSPALWRGARPLATELLAYAVGDVFQLLQLADELCFHLGEAGEAVVATLSQAHAGDWRAGEGVGCASHSRGDRRASHCPRNRPASHRMLLPPVMVSRSCTIDSWFTVAHLSPASAEWKFEEGDRGYAAGGTRSYAAATKLPLGVDMQLILEPPEYRPRWAALCRLVGKCYAIERGDGQGQGR